ncbi:unnamed protein product, partial [Iphiclides podalirius]
MVLKRTVENVLSKTSDGTRAAGSRLKAAASQAQAPAALEAVSVGVATSSVSNVERLVNTVASIVYGGNVLRPV